MGVALPSVPDTDLLIRTDKLLSNVNHRLYRQSRVYNVKIDIDTDLLDGQTVDVYALADTWYNMKAYQLAKKVFDENGAEESAQLGSSRARWNDFRVDTPQGAQDLQAVQFSSSLGVRFTAGEYLMSQVADSASADRTFSWDATGSTTIYNIIDEYDRTGETSQTPTFGSVDVAYDGLDDSMDDGQMDHLSRDGNNPPYDSRDLENQCWVKVGTLFIRASGTNKISTGYFNAPCGLVVLRTSGGLEANGISESVHLTVKAGDYKGVHAPSMLE
jgi:hypothetical protein